MADFKDLKAAAAEGRASVVEAGGAGINLGTHRIRLAVTIEVDADAWANTFGQNNILEVATDVRSYFTTAIQGLPVFEEIETKVTVTK